jgi:hypothetical protein
MVASVFEVAARPSQEGRMLSLSTTAKREHTTAAIAVGAGAFASCMVGDQRQAIGLPMWLGCSGKSMDAGYGFIPDSGGADRS